MKISTKKIIRIIVIVVIAALVGVSIYSINAERLNGNALPMPFGIGMSVVLSGSMEPELSMGDLIVVFEEDTFEVGDVIVFQSGRTAVVHRIISIDGEELLTQGDANNIHDEPIKLSQVKGKVAFSIPLIGYLVNIIKTPIGTILLLGLAIWLMESSFKKDKRKDQAELDAIRDEIEKLKNQQNN